MLKACQHILGSTTIIIAHQTTPPLTYINDWTEHSSNDSNAGVQGAAVMYYIPTGRRHDEGGTLLCSKFRLQIKNRTKPLTGVIFRGTRLVRVELQLSHFVG